MAETIGIEVFLGMDSQQLQAELQKAENQLKQFQNQLKKSTDTQDIIRLNKDIANTRGTIENLNSAMGNVAKKSGDATQSLINLSRVAQDAPYGFIGIANNINPLLESFQRLQKDTKESGGALNALVQGLTGPAGLGLAVGVVTSLLTVYSKEIADFFKSPTDKLKEFREELKKTNQEVYKIVGEIQANRSVGLNLVNLITGGNATQQEEALKRLKNLYTENKAIQDAKLGNDKQYYINLVNAAAKQKEAIDKQDNNTKLLSQLYDKENQLEDERNKKLSAAKDIKKTISTGAGAITTVFTAEQQRVLINQEYDKSLGLIRTKIKQAEALSATFLSAATGVATVDKKGGKKTDNTFSSNLTKENRLLLYGINQRKQLLKEIGQPILQETAQSAADKERKRKADIAAFGKQQISGDFGKSLEGATSQFYKDESAKNDVLITRIALLKEQSKAYAEMADSVSNYATNALMGLWSAMEQGMSIGEALGQMFMDLAKQIAAAAIKALIFRAILAAASGGTSEGAAAAGAALKSTGSFWDLFKSILGIPVTKNAQGGITNGPSWGLIGEAGPEAIMPLSKLGSLLNTTFNAGAMSGDTAGGNGQFVLRGNDLVLALQRSNYSLNLRRGA